jgi:hypothetical protein
MIRQLIKLANLLDRLGLTKEADELDEVTMAMQEENENCAKGLLGRVRILLRGVRNVISQHFFKSQFSGGYGIRGEFGYSELFKLIQDCLDKISKRRGQVQSASTLGGIRAETNAALSSCLTELDHTTKELKVLMTTVSEAELSSRVNQQAVQNHETQQRDITVEPMIKTHETRLPRETELRIWGHNGKQFFIGLFGTIVKVYNDDVEKFKEFLEKEGFKNLNGTFDEQFDQLDTVDSSGDPFFKTLSEYIRDGEIHKAGPNINITTKKLADALIRTSYDLELLNLANRLDQRGFVKEADMLDFILIKLYATRF